MWCFITDHVCHQSLLTDHCLLRLFMSWWSLFCFSLSVASDAACLLTCLLTSGVHLVSFQRAEKRRYSTALWPTLNYLLLLYHSFLSKVVSCQSMSHWLSQCIWQPVIYLYCWIESHVSVLSFDFELHHDTFSLLLLLEFSNWALTLSVFIMLLCDFLFSCIWFTNVLGSLFIIF